MAAAQFFSFSRLFELRREDTCAMVANPFPATREKVEMASCHGQGGDQEWAHTKVRIIRSVALELICFLGGENYPQSDQKVPGCWPWSEYGTSLCCSLPEYSFSSLVFRSLHRQLKIVSSTKKGKTTFFLIVTLILCQKCETVSKPTVIVYILYKGSLQKKKDKKS